MPPTAPTISSIKMNSLDSVTIIWTIPTSAESGVNGYKIYRDSVFLKTMFGKTTTTCTDEENLVLGTTYDYTIKAFDSQGYESDFSSTYSKEFSRDEYELDDLERYLTSLGGQNMMLIVNDQEIPILTAMKEYINDVILAIDQGVQFDTEYKKGLATNINTFWYMPMDDLWNFTLGLPYRDNLVKNRRFSADPEIKVKLKNILIKIYQTANYFYNR